MGKRISSGDGFIEGIQQMEDAARAKQDAKEAGDTGAEARATARFDNAQAAVNEYRNGSGT